MKISLEEGRLLTVASFLLASSPGGSHRKCLPVTLEPMRGVPPTQRLPHPRHLGPLRDETVRWAKSDSTPIASLPISKSSSSRETGLAGREQIPSSSTSMSCVWSSARGESEAGVVVLSEGASLTPGAGATSACAL